MRKKSLHNTFAKAAFSYLKIILMFSNATQYAIRTVLQMAQYKDSNRKITIKELSGELSIPSPFLSKIMQKLAKADIASSAKGRNGGFFLSEENLQKTVLDIIICIEGQDVLNTCILGLPECTDTNPCPLHRYYSAVKTQLHKAIAEASIEKLAFPPATP